VRLLEGVVVGSNEAKRVPSGVARGVFEYRLDIRLLAALVDFPRHLWSCWFTMF
jgi:hypothetical protein